MYINGKNGTIYVYIVFTFIKEGQLMVRDNLYEQRIIDYSKNIKINIFFNEKGEEINVLMKEIIVNNCNPLQRKKLEL